MRLIEFFSIFNLHLKHKTKFFKIMYYPKIKPLLKIFFNLNTITKVKIVKNEIFIWINTTNPLNTSLKLKLIYKPSKPRKISLKTLLKIESSTYSNILILMTNKGMLTNIEALNKRIGGILLFKIT